MSFCLDRPDGERIGNFDTIEEEAIDGRVRIIDLESSTSDPRGVSTPPRSAMTAIFTSLALSGFSPTSVWAESDGAFAC